MKKFLYCTVFLLCLVLLPALMPAHAAPYTLTAPDLANRIILSPDGKTATLFAPGVSKQGGWYDINKLWDGYDGRLCWGASCSNVIAWYLDTCQAGGLDVSRYERKARSIFETFRMNWNPMEGYDPMQGFSWYFTGEVLSGAKPPELLHYPSGGYLKTLPHCQSGWSILDPVNHYSIVGNYQDQFPFIDDCIDMMPPNGALYNHRNFSKTIIEQLSYGAAVLNVSADGGTATGGHAITLWGCDFDQSTGLISKIYVTDSDDENMYPGAYLKELKIKARRPDADGIQIQGYYLNNSATPISKLTASTLLYAYGVVNAQSALNGTVEISSYAPMEKDILLASFSSPCVHGQLEFSWYSDDGLLAAGETYQVQFSDLGKQIWCEVSCSDLQGMVQSRKTTPVAHHLTFVGKKEPTCTRNGRVAYWHCDRCGKKFKDRQGSTELASVIVDKVPHRFGERLFTDGRMYWKTCEVCGFKTIKRLHDTSGYQKPGPHLFIILSDAKGHWTACPDCGYVSHFKHPHTFGSWQIKPTASGVNATQRVCSGCGYVQFAAMPAIDPPPVNDAPPKTGDASPLFVWFAAASAAWLGFWLLMIFARKRG